MMPTKFDADKWMDEQATAALTEMGLPPSRFHIDRYWKGMDLAAHHDFSFQQVAPDEFKIRISSHTRKGVYFRAGLILWNNEGFCTCEDYRRTQREMRRLGVDDGFMCKHLIAVILQLRQLNVQ